MQLWISSQNGSTIAQLLPKIVEIPPVPALVDGPDYMSSAEPTPQSRDVAAFAHIPDERYSKTGPEKTWSRPTALTEFSKSPTESYKEFCSRFQRCVNRLGALQLHLVPKQAYGKASNAPELQDAYLPIVLLSLGTKQNPNDAIKLEDIIARMFVTRRAHSDRSDICDDGTNAIDLDRGSGNNDGFDPPPDRNA